MVSGQKPPATAGGRWLLPWRRDFDAIEILTVIAIIGILASVIIVSVLRFLETSTLNAAKTEMANVKTAALAYYGQHNAWPPDSRSLTPWIEGTIKAIYVFDGSTGLITGVSAVTWPWITWSPPPGPPFEREFQWTR